MNKKPAPDSLAATSYAQVRRMIIRGEMGPGHRFTELSLANELGVGKTPIREALGRLVQDGLVQNLPRVGYNVTPITLRNVAQLFDFRLIIEPASARMAAGRLSREQEAELRAIVDVEAPTPPTEGHLDRITEANRRFHLIVAKASQNDLLLRAVESTLDEAERLVRLVIEEFVTSSQHRRLLDAIVAGQGDLAEELARAHVVGVRDQVMSAYLGSPTVMDAQFIPTGTSTTTKK